MNNLIPQRRKIAILAAAIACMSGGPVLLKGHPRLLMVWIGFMALALVIVFVEMAKFKRQEQ